MSNHPPKSARKSFPTGTDGLLDAVWYGALISIFLVLVFAHAVMVFAHTLERATFVASVSVPSHANFSDRAVLRAPQTCRDRRG
jgi:hypothetical protein